GAANKSKFYDSINDCIVKINKQIIVFIDDLDRLDCKEVIEVLRIVRNTANFTNMVYVVAYDRSYVNQAIKKINKFSFETYLEKIFQVEFSLPTFDISVLKVSIWRRLSDEGGFPDDGKSWLMQAINVKDNLGNDLTDQFIRTPRDTIRLANAFLF